MQNAVLCQLSGGYDSVAALILCRQNYEIVHTVFFDYGQLYARQEALAVEYVLSYFPDVVHHSHALDVPQVMDGMVSAYIPLRNMVLGALSFSIAVSVGVSKIAVGNKTLQYRKDDPYCFKDCTRVFYDALGNAASQASESGMLCVEMPLIRDGKALTKVQVLKIIVEAGIDLHKLWSCYGDGASPCGECFHCKELREAMACI